jgi:hypothetical protein
VGSSFAWRFANGRFGAIWGVRLERLVLAGKRPSGKTAALG